MRKKTFVISIPMLPADNLKVLNYKNGNDESVCCRTRFPGIALLRDNMFGEVEISIITVRTADAAGRTEYCYELFKKELQELSIETGIELRISREIVIPHNETEAKEKLLLRELFECFPRHANVYMDVTYGSKLTAMEMFSSLCYAEVAEGCSIKSVVYGKYAHDGSDSGELFDVTGLYHTMRFMETASHMGKDAFKDLVRQIVED